MNKKNAAIYILSGIFIFQDALYKGIPGLGIVKYFDEILVCVLSVIAIVNITRKKEMQQLSKRIFILLVIFSLIGLISSFINSDIILRDLLISNFLSIKFLIIVIALMNIPFQSITIKYMKNSLIFYSNIVMIFAVFNFLFPVAYKKIFPFITLRYRFNLPAVCSLFTHPGTYGWFMLLVSIYFYSLYLIQKEKKYLMKFVITAIFALLSFRVKVILGLVVVLGYSLYLEQRKNARNLNAKKIMILTIIIISILFVFKDLLIDTYIRYFTTQYGESARQSLTINSFNVLIDYFPLGVGFGKFASFYARKNYSEYYYQYNMEKIYGLEPHNPVFATDTYWPSIIGETGLIGTIIFVSIFIILYRSLMKKINKKSLNNAYNLFAMFVFIQSLVESTSEPIFNNAPQFILIAFIIGIFLLNDVENNISDEEDYIYEFTKTIWNKIKKILD